MIAEISHLKDDLSHYYYSFETSETSFSEFSSFLRVDNIIKDSPKVSDEKIEEIINFNSKDLTAQLASIASKTSREVCNTKISTNKVQDSGNLTSNHVRCDYLVKCSAVSSQHVRHSCEEYYFDVYYYFRYQLFEDEPELNDIQSSVIVGNICEKSPRLNASQTSSEEGCLNKRSNWNYEDLNEYLNLVNGDNKVGLITAKEE